jgi:hypothetical protein
MLDSVRVIGNDAVHPGVMELRDDKELVLKLFRILNIIVEETITDRASETSSTRVSRRAS